jgi:GNAT superfamily N-acetyltransferase
MQRDPREETSIDIEAAIPERLEGGDAVLECSLVPWDSTTFGFPVAQVNRIDLGDHADARVLLQAFDAWCAARGVRLVSCRLDHRQLRESMALEAHGFRFLEMVYGPRLVKLEDVGEPRHVIRVSEALPADLGEIEDIAYSAFSTGRFLLDWRLSPELSQRRYASWVRRSFTSANQTVLKGEIDNALVGFFIVENQQDKRVYWHLTAVAPQWQGKGLGLSLWRTMLLRHKAEGASSVETTISGHNSPAMNLYARLGFSFGPAQMTFHMLREPK